MLIENTEFAYNNYQLAAGLGFESGGTKFVKTNGLVLRNNFVHHNKGPGLWLDIGNSNFLIEGNTVEDQLQDGIFIEISYGGIIRLNTCRRNGLDDTRAGSWPWGAGITIATSGGTGMEIYSNTLTANAHGISLVQQARGSNHGDGSWVDPEMLVQKSTCTTTRSPCKMCLDICMLGASARRSWQTILGPTVSTPATIDLPTTPMF